jgi:TolA-binding protein
MEIMTALSSAKTAFELARALQNGLAKGQIKPDEVPARLMELQQHILQMQSVVHDLAEENRVLSQRLDEREALKALNEDMEYVQSGGFYARKSEQLSIPYCQVCWKKDNLTIPLERTASPGYLRCAVHNTTYETDEYREYLKSVKDGVPMRKRHRF